ncbi:MAG TPA: hypothetical protein VGM92_04660 [Candidatus Kapabacteria bacterium]|jgi:hypothetical protein
MKPRNVFPAVRFQMRIPMLSLVYATLSFTSIALSSCSSITDPATQTPGTEMDVRNYYLPLQNKGPEYNYSVTSNSQYVPATGALTMEMQGPIDTVNNNIMYGCLWSYPNFGQPSMWFYRLSSAQAINCGVESSPENYSDSWVDLQAPLEDTAHWTFTSQGEQITAKVTKYGATAQVNGKTYDNVLMVQYTGTGANGTTGVQWFSKGVGLIFSNITRPNEGTTNYQIQNWN